MNASYGAEVAFRAVLVCAALLVIAAMSVPVLLRWRRVEREIRIAGYGTPPPRRADASALPDTGVMFLPDLDLVRPMPREEITVRRPSDDELTLRGGRR